MAVVCTKYVHICRRWQQMTTYEMIYGPRSRGLASCPRPRQWNAARSHFSGQLGDLRHKENVKIDYCNIYRNPQ